MKTLKAHFDGKFIELDERADLKLNEQVTVLVPDTDDVDVSLNLDFARLSAPPFQAIWDNPLDADYDRL